MKREDFLKQWHTSGKQDLAAQVAPETINLEQRTVDVIWYTGVDVDRYSYMEGAYVLRFDPKGADLSLLNNGSPVLDNHDSYDGAAGQLGKVERAWIDGKNYKATLRFRRSTEMTGPRPEVDGLWQDIIDKIVCKFSMGVELLTTLDQRNKDNQLEIRTATSWRPFELSLAPIPADFGTTTLSAESAIKPPANIAAQQLALSHRVREAEILRLR